MKIRARLAYDVLLETDVPDAMRAFVANPQVLLDQAQGFAKPALAAAVAGMVAKLALIGVKVKASDGVLKLQVEPEEKSD
jgi:hypothetical protein